MSSFIQPFACIGVALASMLTAFDLCAEPPRDIREVPCDLTVPQMTAEAPAAGKRVKHQLPEFAGTELFHVLYLPTSWELGKRYPVIFEYPGNGPYKNKLGDTNSGRLEDCNLGFGISAGKDFIWVCLPFVEPKKKTHALQWWGDADATVRYCKAAVKQTCDEYGGDPDRLVLCGFSRGAIACNYIGLRDDEIAKLWRCMVVHSHYDGVRRWPYADSDAASAAARLKRLAGRPQFITHEASIDATRDYLKARSDNELSEQLTFLPLPFPNHTDTWVLRDLPERQHLRRWLAESLHTENGR
jgi:hypothetical protein